MPLCPRINESDWATIFYPSGISLEEGTKTFSADAAAVSAGIEKADVLRLWLLDRWPHAEIFPSEIVRHAPIRALRESPADKAAIAILAKHGWLVALPEGQIIQGAARNEAWQIVGKRHEI
jgi:hypothetical protein